LFAQYRAGQPYSMAFCTTNSAGCTVAGTSSSTAFTGAYDQLFGQAATSTNHSLLYLPQGANGVVTATSDPRVIYAPGFDLAAFNAFIKNYGLQGREGTILPRNAFRSHPFFSGDLHLAQEIPVYPLHGGSKLELYADIINFP